MKCLIVDDEPSAVNILKSYIDNTEFLELSATARDPLEALKLLQTLKVDLVFLDIHMPKLSGIDFLKMIKGKTNVILTTAYSEFAVEGFEHEAVDYLLKPIPFDRFLQSVQRCLNKSTIGNFSSIDAVPSDKESNYIFVKTESKGKIIKVDFKNILYIEGLKNYVSIYTPTERIITYSSMKDMEIKLPSHFIRVHKSYIISMDHLKAVDGNQILLNGIKAYVPIGETFRSRFFDSLQEKIMGGKS